MLGSNIIPNKSDIFLLKLAVKYDASPLKIVAGAFIFKLILVRLQKNVLESSHEKRINQAKLRGSIALLCSISIFL